MLNKAQETKMMAIASGFASVAAMTTFFGGFCLVSKIAGKVVLTELAKDIIVIGIEAASVGSGIGFGVCGAKLYKRRTEENNNFKEMNRS